MAHQSGSADSSKSERNSVSDQGTVIEETTVSKLVKVFPGGGAAGGVSAQKDKPFQSDFSTTSVNTASSKSTLLETNGTSSGHPFSYGQSQPCAWNSNGNKPPQSTLKNSSEKVEYESDDDDNGFSLEKSRQKGHNGQAGFGRERDTTMQAYSSDLSPRERRKDKSLKGEEYESEEEDYSKHSKGIKNINKARGHGPLSSSTSSFGGKKPVTKKDLDLIGDFKPLDQHRQKAEIRRVLEYVTNSHGVSQRAEVKVHNILINSSVDLKKNSTSSKKSGFVSKSQPKESEYRMMLWCKTSSEVVRRFAKREDSCLAFYDRIARLIDAN